MSQVPHLFPNFIGIGAARSGSTWLFKNLEKHPDVWIPHIKELHYFSRSQKYHGPSYLKDSNWMNRIFSRDSAYRKYRQLFFKTAGSNIIKPSIEKLRWDMKYFFGTPSDDWYLTLFDEGYGKTTGEITPQYSVLDIGDIKSLKRLGQDVKIIYLLRDPVERAWSLVRYHEKRYGEPLTSFPIDKIIKLAQHPAIVAQSDYKTILDNWRSVFDEESLFVAFYDEIHDRPVDLMQNVFKFLGLADAREISSSLDSKKVHNASFDKSMPHELRRYLINFYYEGVKALSYEEDSYYSKWLELYDEWLEEN